MARAAVVVTLLLALSATQAQAGVFRLEAMLPTPYRGIESGAVDSRLVLLGGDLSDRERIWWYDAVTHLNGSYSARLPDDSFVSAWSGRTVYLVRSVLCPIVQDRCLEFWKFNVDADTMQRVPAAPSILHDHPNFPRMAWHGHGAPLNSCGGGCLYVFMANGEVHSVNPETGQTRLVTVGDFRGEHEAVPFGDAIYLFGGLNATGPTNKVWRFDPAAGTISVLPTPGPCTCRIQSAVKGDTVLLFAASSLPGFVAMDKVWTFDEQRGLREAAWRLPAPISVVGAAVIGDELVLAGGVSGQQQRREVWHRSFVNDAPMAPTVWVNPSAPTAGAVVEFDAAATDPDGIIASVAWEFGDGGRGTGAHASHAYAAAGSYEVTARVTDNDGATAQRTVTVQVQAPPSQSSTGTAGPPPSSDPPPGSGPPANSAPTAHASCVMDGLLASCSALGSSDADGDALAYAWDWGDGSRDEGTPVTHRYASAGTYSVRLRVSDGNLQDDETVQVVAQAPSGTQPSVSPTPTPTPASASSPTSASWSITLKTDDEAQESPGFLASGVLLAVAAAAFAVRRKLRE